MLLEEPLFTKNVQLIHRIDTNYYNYYNFFFSCLSTRYNEHLIGEVRQCMKNLKEMMERKIQDEPSCEPPHYPHFRHAPPSSAMSWEDKESHRQPLSALSRRCSVSAPLKVEPRSAESEHRESFLGHGSTLRSNRFNAPPPHSTSIPPPVQHLRTKLKEPKRSSPRHQVASQRCVFLHWI